MAGLGGALGLGRPRERLARQLADHFGTPDLLLTDSGTSALRLAIRGAVGLVGRDSVALPVYCCYDVVTAAVGAGARILLYDLDPVTLGPDRDSLEAVLRAGPGAVVVAHLYGIPVDVPLIVELVDAHGALLIEDAAQGFGGRIDGRPLGALGSLGVLSFGRGKGITGGGGGALLANDARGREALDAVRTGRPPASGRAGWREISKLAAQWLFGRPSVYGLVARIPRLGLGDTRYHEPWPPRDVARGSAAAVLSNWNASIREAEARRENAQVIGERGIRIGSPESAGREVHATPLRLPVLTDAIGRRPGLDAAAHAGIVRSYPTSLLPVLGRLGRPTPDQPFEGGDRLVTELLTAPVHSRTRPENVRRELDRHVPRPQTGELGPA